MRVQPSFRRNFRHVELGVHEQRELESADGQHVLFCEDQFAGPLPMATQLSLLTDAGQPR